jgi:hypothetical protein
MEFFLYTNVTNLHILFKYACTIDIRISDKQDVTRAKLCFTTMVLFQIHLFKLFNTVYLRMSQEMKRYFVA